MFRGWGFLLAEMWVLIALAALIGLFVGWLIWGRGGSPDGEQAADLKRLRDALDACETRHRSSLARIADLENAAQNTAPTAPSSEAEATPLEPAASGDIGTKPSTLDAPRGGVPDDLKRIKGVGPKLEALCNRLGFWHFDQIANWTDAEIAWVDANLETFKGRVTRDNWVAQARALADEGQA